MTKQQRLVLLVSILASFVAFLDIAVVNVGLPAIQQELGGGLSAQQWVVDAYLITLGALILIAGSLSDLFGRKKILSFGLIGFLVTSLLCAISPNIPSLIISRALQGIAGALLVPSSLALIISTFSGREQGKAIGTWTAWTGISFIIGPLIGGLLVDNGSWRYIFAINTIPIAVTLWLLRLVTIKDKVKKNTPIDVIGTFLCALGLGGSVFALIEQPRYGWTHPLIIFPLTVGLLLLAVFLWHEQNTRHPMLPLSLFKHHNFSVGNIATSAVYAALSAATFLIIVFVQQVGGYSALAAGMSLVPVTLLLFILSPLFGSLAGKYGPRLFMGIGPIIGGLGFLLLLRVDADANYWTQVFPAIFVFGLGLSITVAPLTAAILGDVETEHAGIASAINNAVARVAGLIAIAAIGAIVAAQFGAVLDKKLSTAANDPITKNFIAEAKLKPLALNVPKNLSHTTEVKIALSDAATSAFHAGVFTMSILMITGGVISAIGIQNPKHPKDSAHGN